MSYDRDRVSQDTRSANRFIVELEVEHRAGEAEPWKTAHTRNASLGGLFLEETALSVGAKVQMRIRLPGQTLEAGGVVRWQDGTGVGVQFDGLRAKDVWALGKFFESQSQSPS